MLENSEYLYEIIGFLYIFGLVSLIMAIKKDYFSKKELKGQSFKFYFIGGLAVLFATAFRDYL